MPKWEYLELYIDYDDASWVDSLGRKGKLSTIQPKDWKIKITSLGETLNRLGDEGWEITAVRTEDYYQYRRFVLKRSREG